MATLFFSCDKKEEQAPTYQLSLTINAKNIYNNMRWGGEITCDGIVLKSYKDRTESKVIDNVTAQGGKTVLFHMYAKQNGDTISPFYVVVNYTVSNTFYDLKLYGAQRYKTIYVDSITNRYERLDTLDLVEKVPL